MKPDQNHVNQLAENHWLFVEGILVQLGEDKLAEKCAYFYREALTHGYKHGWNDRHQLALSQEHHIPEPIRRQMASEFADEITMEVKTKANSEK